MREVEEPFGAGPEGLLGDAAQAQPDPLPSGSAGSRACCAATRQAAVENVALWHERDISHSGAERVVLPDATILLDYMQHVAARVAEGMTVYPERMLANLELTHGALHSQRILTALVEAGMPRDDAYRLVQESAQRAWDEETDLPRAAGAAPHPTSTSRRRSTTARYLHHVPEVFERLETLRG